LPPKGPGKKYPLSFFLSEETGVNLPNLPMAGKVPEERLLWVEARLAPQ
jgi:hypothetical protein